MNIYSSGQTVFTVFHIEGRVGGRRRGSYWRGGASGMNVDRIREIGDRASEGTDFIARFLARLRTRDERRSEIEISFGEELMEVDKI